MSASETGSVSFELYRYTPSLVAAVIFIVLFALRLSIIFIKSFVHDLGTSQYLSLEESVIQIIGYICRALAHNDKENIPIYSVGTIMILLAPPLYAASIYMTLGRLIVHLKAERLSLVSVKWLTAIFVTGDVIAFVMQAAGGGIMASGTLSAMITGEHITIGGLAVQLIFFSVFIIASSIFHYRIRENPTKKSLSRSRSANLKVVMVGLYVASILILIRSIFRLIEYAQGNDGYLISHEAFMYVFDATLMFFAMIAMSIFHPSTVLSRLSKKRRSSRKSHSGNGQGIRLSTN